MGFRSGAYATVWEVSSLSGTQTKARISTSYKNKNTGEYEQDFGGFVVFTGTACAKSALSLHKGDRVKLGDVDVSNRYDAKAGKEYTNFKIFSFESAGDGKGRSSSNQHQSSGGYKTSHIDDSFEGDSDDLPFD